MPARIRRSIAISPGIHLNVGGAAPSLSIGRPGAIVNVGPRGASLTASLPGTGLRYRKRVAKPDPALDLAVGLLHLAVGSPASRGRKRGKP